MRPNDKKMLECFKGDTKSLFGRPNGCEPVPTCREPERYLALETFAKVNQLNTLLTMAYDTFTIKSAYLLVLICNAGQTVLN